MPCASYSVWRRGRHNGRLFAGRTSGAVWRNDDSQEITEGRKSGDAQPRERKGREGVTELFSDWTCFQFISQHTYDVHVLNLLQQSTADRASLCAANNGELLLLPLLLHVPAASCPAFFFSLSIQPRIPWLFFFFF